MRKQLPVLADAVMKMVGDADEQEREHGDVSSDHGVVRGGDGGLFLLSGVVHRSTRNASA